MHSDQSNPRLSAVNLLRRLNSSDASAAWAEFLDRYSPLIMNTASQFEYEQNRIDECFIFICEKLNDNGFRRLLKFNTEGSASFRTWLGTVVFNLCVDWHRKEFGRVIMLPAISALPTFDQAVYRLVIEQGMSKETCYQTLRADFPDLTRGLVANALARIHSLLTPRQRWQLSVRIKGRRQVIEDGSHDRLDKLPAPDKEPEAEVQIQQENELLQEALSLLPKQQRVLLQLRFQHGLSLERIKQIQHLGDTSRAWRHIQAAKKALFRLIQEIDSKRYRKN